MAIMYVPPQLTYLSKHPDPRARKEAGKALDIWYRAWLTDFNYSWDNTEAKHYFGIYAYCHGFHPTGLVKTQLLEYLERQ